jgi:hypothetical protein
MSQGAIYRRLKRLVRPCGHCGKAPTITSGVGGNYVACFAIGCHGPRTKRHRTRFQAVAEWNEKMA